MVAELTLNKDPQQQRSTNNIRSGTGIESKAITSTGHSSSIEAGFSNEPTANVVHGVTMDLRDEINNLVIQKQERPRSPEATSATQAKTSQTTRILQSAGEYVLKAQTGTVASAPAFPQPTHSTPPAAPLSPNDLRSEIQSITMQMRVKDSTFSLSSKDRAKDTATGELKEAIKKSIEGTASTSDEERLQREISQKEESVKVSEQDEEWVENEILQTTKE
ncbi:hypothetical protein BGZ81_000048 [Podila clonocystis]|nr:hypothetical protein BGZ81_000048 [Podila clonocystis]